MSKNREKRRQWQSAEMNSRNYWHYMSLLKEISCNMFKWENLPEEIDARFLELTLYERSLAIFFFDKDTTDKYYAIQGAPSGQINMYHNPTMFMAYGPGGFHRLMKASDCVPIWGNFLRQPTVESIEIYARRLAEFDRTVDVNLRAQKTPVIITAPEEMRLTMKNFYQQYEGNEPAIFSTPTASAAIGEGVQAFKTDAPYVVDKLLMDKAKVWGEIMTFLGIDNANQEKRERLVANEVEANNGQIEMSRLRGLDARRLACDEINAKYGLNVSVNFNYDILTSNFRFMQDMERQAMLTTENEKTDADDSAKTEVDA